MHGVDISSHQPDWTPAVDDSYVFVKVSEGTSYRNPLRGAQVAKATKAGLLVGWYHFMHPGNAKEQAAYFVKSLAGYLAAGDLLVCDWENTGDGHPSPADAAAFIAEVKRLGPGHRVGLYCNQSDWLTTTVKPGDFLWIARYGMELDKRVTGWTFWQYADHPIDQNRSRFATADELQDWAMGRTSGGAPSGTGTTPTIPPAVNTPEVPSMPIVKHSAKWAADYVSWHGGYVTVQDAAILDAIQAEVAPWWGRIVLMQGGLSTSVTASANTHAGLGAFDVQTNGKLANGKMRTAADVKKLAAVFMRCGLVFFIRGYGLGRSLLSDPFRTNRHGHVVSRESYSSLHPEAKAQYKEFDAYRLKKSRDGDGLVGSHPFPGTAGQFERWATSPYNPANVTADPGVYTVHANPYLYGLDVDRKHVTQHDNGDQIQAAKRIKRWGRENVVTPNGIYYAADYLSTTAAAA